MSNGFDWHRLQRIRFQTTNFQPDILCKSGLPARHKELSYSLTEVYFGKKNLCLQTFGQNSFFDFLLIYDTEYVLLLRHVFSVYSFSDCLTVINPVFYITSVFINLALYQWHLNLMNTTAAFSNRTPFLVLLTSCYMLTSHNILIVCCCILHFYNVHSLAKLIRKKKVCWKLYKHHTS